MLHRVAMGGSSGSGGAGSGAVAAAARLLVPMLQLAHWALDRAGARAAEGVRVGITARIADVSAARHVESSAPEAWPEHVLIEAALCMPNGDWETMRAGVFKYILRVCARNGSSGGSGEGSSALAATRRACALMGCGEVLRSVACGGACGADAAGVLEHAGGALSDGPALVERLREELVEVVSGGVWEAEDATEALDAAELLALALESEEGDAVAFVQAALR